MSNLAVMLDYGTTNYGDMELFFGRFLDSDISRQFANGNPKYIAGMSGIELAKKVIEDTEGTPVYAEYRSIGSTAVYWAGWTLAYLQWYSGLSFKALADKGIRPCLLIKLYPTLHEADISKTTDILKEKLQNSIV